MSFLKKLFRYSFSIILPYYVYFTFFFYRFFSEDYAHKKIIQLKTSYNIKKFFIDYFIKKFPNYPYFYWERYKITIQHGDSNYLDYLKKYSQVRKSWVHNNLLQYESIEFVEEKVVAGSFGNIYYLYSLILANKLKLRKNKKLILFLQSKVTNEILFEYFKEYLTIVKDLKTISNTNLIVDKLSCHLGSTIEINEDFLQSPEAQNIIVQKNEEDKIKLFALKNNHYQEGIKYLKKKGLTKESWYVTLHVRESTYRPEKNEKFRNADIDDYLPAIKEIVDAGGYVFRVGHAGSKKMPKLDGLIDYANSDDKSELLDVFLGATSKFCIATSSGYYIIPSFFSVPILMTNCPQHAVFFELNSKDLYLPRIFKSTNDEKKLKIYDLFQPPFNNLFSDIHYKKYNLEIIKNSKDDIKLATKEMLDRILLNKNEQSHLQYKINKKIEQKQKNIKKNLIPIANICDNFLKKNIDLI